MKSLFIIPDRFYGLLTRKEILTNGSPYLFPFKITSSFSTDKTIFFSMRLLRVRKTKQNRSKTLYLKVNYDTFFDNSVLSFVQPPKKESDNFGL